MSKEPQRAGICWACSPDPLGAPELQGCSCFIPRVPLVLCGASGGFLPLPGAGRPRQHCPGPWQIKGFPAADRWDLNLPLFKETGPLWVPWQRLTFQHASQ